MGPERARCEPDPRSAGRGRTRVRGQQYGTLPCARRGSGRLRDNTAKPKLNRIYTRVGDEGMTGLGGGKRVSKDSARVSTYGTVDELNSQIGLALATGLCARLTAELGPIQNQLFDLGSDLATPATSQARHPVPTVEPRHIERLEALIDEFNEVVGPLTNFLLPGGSPGAAQLHVARTVCRRAERSAVTLAREEPIGPTVLPYLNRLSDALFVMARYENHERGVTEPLWQPGA
jgi:cob(I)alamin adenosyltransferase